MRTLLPSLLLVCAAGCGTPEPARSADDRSAGRPDTATHRAAIRPDTAAERPAADAGARTETEAGMPAVPADSLRLSLEVPPTVRAGEPVPLTLRITNSGKAPVELHLRGRTIVFDVVVEAPDGAVLWRRLEGRTAPAILQVRTLPPGESLELHDEWDQRTRDGTPVAPGSYTVRGTVPAVSPGPLEAPPASLRILPRDAPREGGDGR